MKKVLFLFMIIILSTTYFAQTKHAISVDDLWNMNRIGSFAVSPNGQRIVFSVTSYSMEENKGVTDVWITNSNGSGSKQILSSVSQPQFMSAGKNIFYIKDGNAFSSDLSGKNEQKLSSFYSGVSGAEFSANGKQILFASSVYAECETQDCNERKDIERENSKVKAEMFTELMYRHWNDWRGPKISHLFLMDLETKISTDLTLNSKFDTPPLALGSSNDYSFSPDGKEVGFAMNTSDFLATSTNNDIFILSLNDVKEGVQTPNTKISTSKGNDNQPVYSPDGKYIAFRSMERAGFEADKQRLMLYNRKLKITTDISKDFDLSTGEIVWSNDSKSIYFTAANKIYNSIYKIDISNNKLTTILEEVVVSSLQLSDDGSKLFFKKQNATMPYEIFSTNSDGTNLAQITNINGNLLSQIEMNKVESFWSDGAEGAKVQSILLKPPFFDESKKYPLIFLIHGGPQGHWKDDFHFRWSLQMFASQGYVVVAPNPRGSKGYGQKYTDEISKDWSGKVYTDLMNSYDYALANYNFIDDKNTFAAGASYGGYMIAWIEGHNTK
ncbi:MAG: prolyl oligopeptidase family serine peptidase, partial [Melioribacteraceae bacterium]